MPSSQESLCCSFFSSSERLQRPLKEKIAAIEQLLDEINGRELYLSDINQTVIDKKKESGRIGELSSLWKEAQKVEAHTPSREANDTGLYSPK